MPSALCGLLLECRRKPSRRGLTLEALGRSAMSQQSAWLSPSSFCFSRNMSGWATLRVVFWRPHHGRSWWSLHGLWSASPRPPLRYPPTTVEGKRMTPRLIGLVLRPIDHLDRAVTRSVWRIADTAKQTAYVLWSDANARILSWDAPNGWPTFISRIVPILRAQLFTVETISFGSPTGTMTTVHSARRPSWCRVMPQKTLTSSGRAGQHTTSTNGSATSVFVGS